MRQRVSLIGLVVAARAMGGVGRGFSDSDLGEIWVKLDGSGDLAHVGDANCEPLSLFFYSFALLS